EFRHEADIKGKGLKLGVAYNTSGQRWVEHHGLEEGNQVTIFMRSDPKPAEPGQKPGKPTPAETNLFSALLAGEIDVALFNAYDFNQLAKKRPEYAKLEVANLYERRLVVDMDEVEYLYGLGMVSIHAPILLGNYYDNRGPQAKPEIT